MQKILLSGKQTLEEKNFNNSIHCRLEKGWNNFTKIKLAKEDHDQNKIIEIYKHIIGNYISSHSGKLWVFTLFKLSICRLILTLWQS